MADRDTEIAQLKAEIAALKERPSSGDLEWLKNSSVWKQAEFAASPGWRRANAIIVALGFGAFIITFIIECIR